MNDSVSPQELKEMRESCADIVLIDVRRQVDFDANRFVIPGAIRRLPESVESWSATLPPKTSIVVYCVRGGSVSQSVTPALRRRGLDAKYLAGGFTAWREHGGDVSPADD